MHAYTFSFVLLSKILSCESYHRSRKLDNQNGTLSGRTIAKCLFLPEMGLNDRYRLLGRSRSRCRHILDSDRVRSRSHSDTATATTLLLKFDHSSELPIKIGYATPETLGLDRIAAVVGAVMQCPDKAVLIVDAGTCVTYDLLTADGTFAGGNIAPGIRLRLRAMHEHTGKLPLIDDAGETPEIGFSTETAMRAGAVLGVAYEIEGYIARLNKVYPDLFVFLTGGDALKLAAKIKSRIFVDENLVLTGLNRILQENAKI